MNNNKWLFWWTALFTAVCFDFLFWDKAPGISFPIFILILAGGLILLGRRSQTRLAHINILVTGIALLLAAASTVRDEPFSRLVTVVASLGLVLIVFVTFFTGNWVHYRIFDYAAAFFKLVIAAISRAVFIFSNNPSQKSDGSGDAEVPSTSRRVLLSILRGLLIAVPIVFVLGALLTSADPIFSQQLKTVFDFDNLGEYVVRLVIIVLFAYLYTGALLHALHPENEEVRSDPKSKWLKPFFGWTEAITVLSAVNLLYIAFVTVQLRYFFGGNANIQIDGYTYAEYARRGFGELVVVAVLSLFIYLALGAVVKENTHRQRVVFSGLSILMKGFVLVILLSAFQRMLLYEQAYGFTRLRIYVFIFIAWLAVLLVSTIILEAISRRQRFPLVLLGVLTGFALSFGLINIDGLIVRQNFVRFGSGYQLDTVYLSELSSDAVPAMIDYYKDADVPVEIKTALGEELACRHESFTSDQPTKWQSYHFGRTRAFSLLDSNQALWPEYTFTIRDGIRMIDTPTGSRPCEAYLYTEFLLD